MKNDVQSHKLTAQIGVTAVLLTTVLLAIGVSVTSRVVQQVAQDTQRSESTQVLNQAERAASTGQNGAHNYSDTASSINTNATSKQDSYTGNQSRIYVEAGDTLQANASDVRGKTLRWEETVDGACNTSNPRPAVMVIHDDGTTAEYRIVAPTSCAGTSQYSGYESSLGASSGYQSSWTIPNWASGIVRIKVLYKNAYVNLDGLIQTIRGAAESQSGNEVRVVEQNQTTPAAPHIFDYAIFVANGSITQS